MLGDYQAARLMRALSTHPIDLNGFFVGIPQGGSIFLADAWVNNKYIHFFALILKQAQNMARSSIGVQHLSEST